MHIPVLLHEAVAGLDIKSGDRVLDATVGGGGHARLLCEAAGKKGTLLAIDEDDHAVRRTKEALREAPCTSRVLRSNFRHLDTALKKAGLPGADKILFDLGLSSYQLDADGDGRGFSFRKDEPLIMTFRTTPEVGALTAHDVVNSWDEENIVAILESYGEERFARRIAHAIVRARSAKEIRTARELADIIAASVPRRQGGRGIHPATRTFQAIRMAVNDEAGALKEGLEKAFAALSASGRVAVISFHSIEDRIVKRFFKKKEDEGVARRVTKKPISPSTDEMENNPRARSAKLRIIEKL